MTDRVWSCAGNRPECRSSNPCAEGCRWKTAPSGDENYVSRFVRAHGRAPEFCTRCEQWEGICWHHPPEPTRENQENER